MPNIFFTADTHFGHANILRYCHRPWVRPDDLMPSGEWVSDEIAAQRCEEMNEAMISNWNEAVRPGDLVYHCGDFAFARAISGRDKVKVLVKRLNSWANIQLVIGNHDTKNLIQKLGAFNWVGETKTIQVDGQEIFLSHYSHRVWNHSYRGSWNLYGHSHGNLPDLPDAPATDVGVDRWNYTPVPFERVRDLFRNRKPRTLESHRPIPED